MRFTRRARVGVVALALSAAFLFGACGPCWNGSGYSSCGAP